MNQIYRALVQSKKAVSDERQAEVRNHSSYVAFCAFILAYLGIALISTARDSYVPLSTQVLFVATIIVFAARILHDEGAQFRVPFIIETKTSLNQPQAVRSLPWILLVSGLGITPFGSIALISQYSQYWQSPLDATKEILPYVIAALLSAGFTFLLAKWIKEGRIIAMTILVIGCLANIPGYVNIIALAYERLRPFEITLRLFGSNTLGSNTADTYIFPTGLVFRDPSIAIIKLMIYAWIVYVILRHWRRIEKDGMSYRNEVCMQAEMQDLKLGTKG